MGYQDESFLWPDAGKKQQLSESSQAFDRAPLAARIRPQALMEFFGHEKLFSEHGILNTRRLESNHASSYILWGPPGSGKTTLARLIIDRWGLPAHYLSAVSASLADLRGLTHGSNPNQALILFLDEIHRFNKIQQDALLPALESGQLRLIGATTENPHFELRKALLSRCRVIRLEKLLPSAIQKILRRALQHPSGYGNTDITLADDVFDAITTYADGDARTALNLLELAISQGCYTPDGALSVDLSHLQGVLNDQHLAYHAQSDRRHDLVSAFIKSIRGSDPNAAIYWLACMLLAGEDPHFIMRRLVIAASEDIGLADPSALSVVTACAQALERVGLPEGKYALSQATLYLATAPKSPSVAALFLAEAHLRHHGAAEVPLHLRNGSYSEAHSYGIGVGYHNPHKMPYSPSKPYLPPELSESSFYQPRELGFEKVIKQRLEHWGKERRGTRLG